MCISNNIILINISYPCCSFVHHLKGMNSHHFSFWSTPRTVQGLSKEPWDPWDRGRKCGDDVRSTVTLMPNLVHRSEGALAAIKKIAAIKNSC